MKKSIVTLAALGPLAACGSGSGNTHAAGPASAASGHPRNVGYVKRVNNPWYPLKPGTTLVYRGVKDGRPSRDVFTVAHATKVIDGVRCQVVKDTLYLRGKLEERTTDWYAQDTAGNVWYFGEKTVELDEHGNVKSTSGTWKAGAHGARAGIYFPAYPRTGQSGRQEYYKGQAEDHYRVKSVKAHVNTPAVSSKRAVLTEEWTPLEPGVLDHKYYVRGVGTVLEKTVKGGDERNTLVEVRHG